MADRLSVKKTYKNYVGGKFPRSESGQTFMVEDRKGHPLAACCKSSRKDFRDAVLAAREGHAKWKGANAFLRGQILYRAAEMLEGRSAQFVEDLQLQGMGKARGGKEVQAAVDRLVYYAGWTDKVGALFSAVNPVASSHFCFTVPEPTGIIAILAGGNVALLGMIEAISRVLAGGNSAILVAGSSFPVTASTLGEVWHTSDLPSGALNILTGTMEDLAATAASHREVDGILGVGLNPDLEKSIQESASDSLKRLKFLETANLAAGSPYAVSDFLEMKTTWHPVGI